MKVYISDLERILLQQNIQLSWSGNPNLYFDQTQWLISYKNIEPNTLYVSPSITRGQTALLHNNSVMLLKGCSPEEALTLFLELLQQRQSWEKRMIDIILHQEPLVRFLNVASEPFHCPLFLVDPNNRLLEYSTDTGPHLQQIENYLHNRELLIPMEHAVSNNLMDFPDSMPGEENHILSTRLWHGSQYLGRLFIYHYAQPVNEGIISRIEQIAKLISILLSVNAQQYFATSFISSVLQNACHGKFNQWQQLRTEMNAVGWKPHHHLRILSVGYCDDASILHDLKESFLSLNLPCHFFSEPPKLVILGNETLEPELIQILHNILTRHEIPMSMGISGTIQNIEQIPLYFWQANFALEVAVKHGSDMEMAQHSAVLAMRNLLEENSAFSTWIHPDLVLLRDYDSQNQTELLPTLAQFLACGSNYERVASKMGLHPNTVRYRIRKAVDLIRTNIYDPQDRENLLTSLILL